jgi:putative ABC transport system permease protein
MIKNYLKTVWRQMKKQKVFSVINISSLVLGLSSAFLIMLFIQYEMNYDQFNEKKERVARLTQWFKPDSKTLSHFARCTDGWLPWVDALHEQYPGIKNIARLTRSQGTTLQIGNDLFSENYFFFTDEQVFDVFTIPIVTGDPAKALQNPHSVIITESLAKKYLSGNAIGQILQVIDPQGKKTAYKVTAVMKDWPVTSHMQINFMASSGEQDLSQEWAYIYLLLNEPGDFESLQKKLADFVHRQFGEKAATKSGFQLQKLTDIHLYSNLDRELKVNGDIRNIYILWGVAILIIIIACINFINLTTAQSLARGKEVAIKKTVGSSRRQLIAQFMTEALLICLIALALSLIFVRWFLPELNDLTGKNIQITSLWQGPLIMPLFGTAIILCILACIYPAFILSGFKPLDMLRAKTISGRKPSTKSVFQNILVTAQFIIASVLLTCTFVFRTQLLYIHNKPLGLNKDQVISIGKDIPQTARAQYQRFKQKLLTQSNVINVSACMEEPSYEVKDIGQCYVESKFEGDEKAYLYILPVDENFLDVMQIKVLAGRGFPEHNLDYDKLTFTASANFLTDINNAQRFYILNETALHYIGWQSAGEAIGKQMDWHNVVLDLQRGPVVGVVQDFYFSTLHKEVKPFVLVYEPHFLGSILVKLNASNMQQSIAGIAEIWQEMFPENPFEYHFLDDLYANLYRAEQQFNTIISWFTLIAIGIACLGLIGLVLFTTRQRTKEIGIRKVLGASVTRILSMINRDFLKWVVLANIIAGPLAWFFMTNWLENFAYRIDLTLWPFLISCVLSLVIALLVVSGQALRVAAANPVESLRYE